MDTKIVEFKSLIFIINILKIFGETENNIINYKIKGRYPDRNRVSIVDDLNKKIYDKEVFDVSLDFRPQYPQPLRLWLKGKMKNIKESLNEIEAKK